MNRPFLQNIKRHRCNVIFFLIAVTISGTLLATMRRAHGQGAANPIATVSAASFAAPLAPNSIAAAFGQNLATQLAVARTLPLPTTLAGTTVRVNGEAAPLFFVSPGQINFLIPPGTPAGTASLSVTAGNGVVSSGTVQIAAVAPALFTANANGLGPLAAQLLRVRTDGQQVYESLVQFNGQQWVTRPIAFGPEGELLFLVLYLTGARQAATGQVRVSIGGVEYAPQFVGPVGGLVGLDQINVPLPRNFGGRGRISLLVKAAGALASNAGEFEIGVGAQAANAPLEITAPNQAVLAGEVLELNGAGFAANPRENIVQVISADGVASKADVLAVTSTNIRLRIPFGAGTGALKIIRGQSEAGAPIRVRTSLSGFVEETQSDGRRTPVRNATIRVRDGSREFTAPTDAEGSFVLPEPPVSEALTITVDGATASPCYIAEDFKLPVRAARDNQFPNAIALKRKIGPNIIIGGGNDPCSSALAFTAAEQQQANSVTLTLPDNAVVRFPNGATSGVLKVTAFDRGRTPALLPIGHFSSTIAQIAPFKATITPGAKLTFANNDGLPANSQARLFKFDQAPNSRTTGQFLDASAATVSADGQRVETAVNALAETSYYFVSILRPLAAINGRVLESNGRPVPRALVQARGQAAFTDGFGGFVLSNVPVLQANGDRVRVEVSYQRPDGRVARKDSAEVVLTPGGLATVTPEIVLDPVTTNFPPVLLTPASLTLQAGETREFELAATDPNSGQPPQVSITGGTAASFTTLSNPAPGLHRLRLAPGAQAAGNYTLNLRAADSAGAAVARSIAIAVTASTTAPLAQAQSLTTAEDTPKAITLTGRDPANRPLTFTIVSDPARGSLSGTAPNLTYTPATNFNGADSFRFRVNSGVPVTGEATVFIAVTPVNDAPVLSAPPAQVVNAGESLNLVVTATDVDGEQSLRFTATGLPPGATFIEAARQLVWEPEVEQEGVYAVVFRVADQAGASDSKTVNLTASAKWARTAGPAGADVRTFLSSGGALYAGTHGGGVYRSLDSGRSWVEINKGLASQSLFVLDLLTAGTALLAATRDGVFRSLDEGRNWTAYRDGLTGAGLLGSALVSHQGGVYLGTDGGGVQRLGAAGQNWAAVNEGLSGAGLKVNALLVRGGNLYAGTFGGGVYRLNPDGRSWSALNSGLTGLGLFIQTLTASGTSLYAGTFSRGVFRLNDGERDWQPLNTGLPGGELRVNSLLAQGATLYAGTYGGGVFRSNDGGQNWAAFNNGLTGAQVYVNKLFSEGGNLRAGALAGVVRFDNDEQRWQQANSGLVASHVPALLNHTSGFYAGTASGIHRTTDGGVSWQALNTGLSALRVVSFTANAGVLYAGTDGGGVFRLDGASWRQINRGLTSQTATALGVSSATLYAGTSGGGVCLSRDGGETWAVVNNQLPPNLNVYAFAASGRKVYAGSIYGVFVTEDEGQSWRQINAGLLNTFVTGLAVSGEQLLASTASGGVFVSRIP